MAIKRLIFGGDEEERCGVGGAFRDKGVGVGWLGVCLQSCLIAVSPSRENQSHFLTIKASPTANEFSNPFNWACAEDLGKLISKLSLLPKISCPPTTKREEKPRKNKCSPFTESMIKVFWVDITTLSSSSTSLIPHPRPHPHPRSPNHSTLVETPLKGETHLCV